MSRKKGMLAIITKCGAKKRQGEGFCTQASGWGTDHVGRGRCKLHGGCVPIKTGINSGIKRESLRAVAETFEEIEKPLEMYKELALMRALAVDYINRYDMMTEALLAWNATLQPGYKAVLDDGMVRPPAGRPAQILDLSDAYRLVSEVTKIIKRIEDIRAQNAISRSDFVRLMQEMARVVEAVVDRRADGDQRQAMKDEIKDRWLEIRLA